MKYYTIGEIFRLKLIRGYNGKPYTSLATVSRVVRMKMKWKAKMTKFGPSKVVSEKEILKFNDR